MQTMQTQTQQYKQINEALIEARKSAIKAFVNFRESLKGIFVDNLSAANEATLRAYHAKGYSGTDDEMVDDFERWLENSPLEELLFILGGEKVAGELGLDIWYK